MRLVITCVTITKFIIKVNGDEYGFFEGRGSLRQGDPMSHLLFVLVMEYLTRVLKRVGDLPYFRYHPMCKATRLNYLIFADDLMVFYKGNLTSITRIMVAINHFSRVTCLVANLDKSNIFLAGIPEEEQNRTIEYIGFTRGTLPMRYLGLPLSSKNMV